MSDERLIKGELAATYEMAQGLIEENRRLKAELAALEAARAALVEAGDAMAEARTTRVISWGGQPFVRCEQCFQHGGEQERHADNCPVGAWRAPAGPGDRREDDS